MRTILCYSRIVAWFLLPLSICLEFLVVGLLLLWFTPRKRLGKILTTIGVVLLLLFSFGPVGKLLVRHLESQYPAISDPPIISLEGESSVQWVVVLGAGYNPDPSIPISSRPSTTGLTRLVEGVRIRRGLPGAKLLVLIGGAEDGDDRVQAMTDLAIALGVPPTELSINREAANTLAEVEVIQRTVGEARFVLVTSAFHMPRAVRACQERGLRPIPAPTEYRAVVSEYPLLQALPSTGNLELTETGFYERLSIEFGRRSIGDHDPFEEPTMSVKCRLMFCCIFLVGCGDVVKRLPDDPQKLIVFSIDGPAYVKSNGLLSPEQQKGRAPLRLPRCSEKWRWPIRSSVDRSSGRSRRPYSNRANRKRNSAPVTPFESSTETRGTN